jgi:phosphohistidine swiveling domain-containing protein
MRLVIGLDEIADDDASRVGGKALALSSLDRAGLSVPPTLCLTTDAYELFVQRASLRAVIHQELGRKSFDDMRWEELWDVALRIRNRFLRASLPEEVVAALRPHLESVPPEQALAVRSSAPGEDSPGASFAGLHDSFIGVRGVEATLEAIRRVWASLWTDRALLYRRELGIDADSSAMAVVIQELVEGEVSGIVFGIHPNDPGLAVVEAVYGLNQGLVDGTVEPDRWSVERTSGRTVDHVPPQQRQRMVESGSDVVVESVPIEQSALPPLDEEKLALVFAAVREAEGLFGGPQDMEWTFEDGRLVLLQSRPVTTTVSGEGDKRAWYLSLTRSLHAVAELRNRVEQELLPAMDRQAAEMAAVNLESLDSVALADEIERRRLAHDRWVDVYSRDFIPLAHGIRLFGQFYNEMLKPNDPYEFMGLLVSTPMLSVRRNLMLGELAAQIRKDPVLRRRLENGEPMDERFEAALVEFEREFGDAAFASRKCFGDRARLIRLLHTLADAPEIAEPRPAQDLDTRTGTFLQAVNAERRTLAEQLLDLGRASYRLRDDDNLHLARLEALVLAAVDEGRRRLSAGRQGDLQEVELERIEMALRHPNLVVEPKPTEPETPLEEGFSARPRQLVGQPAGPGLATGPARVIEEAEDLFEFQSGEVLVCDAVDPNMTFIVPMAAALVERRGGMLIHGAIIAREYGLPCVTGVPKATTLIASGDALTVDGYLGIVTLTRD